MEYRELRPLGIEGKYFEGPRRHRGELWFVDSLAMKLHRASPDGGCETVCAIPGIAGGLGFLPNGDPVFTSMFDRKLLTFHEGKVSTLCDLSGVASGSLDDMIIDARGRIFVGDLGFDLMKGGSHDNGQIILVSSNGDARVVARGLRFPNGIAISELGGRMIVAESDGNRLAELAVAPDGSLDLKKRFGRFIEPDGICLDREGAVWAALFQEDAFVRVDASGKIVDRVSVAGRRAIACALGGEDGRTLFCISAVTTHEDLMRGKSSSRIDTVRVEVPGAGFP
ncbi:MAG TPA: SMP-30/gluconolactonase/LRE family protein [Candidatus Binataceae bacterium]|nr:SMP-30/gluconolactonase/LRE family protein [Candidatus Binataceae bacterium]